MKQATIQLNIDTQNGVKSVGAVNTAIKESTTQTKSLKAQLREMTAALSAMEPGTAEFNKMATEAGKLKDTINDTNAVIKATAGGIGENLGGALAKTASIGIAGFQGIASAQALFGVESKALEQTLVKLQALAGLSSAIKELGGIKDTFTAIRASVVAATAAITKDTVAKAANTTGTVANGVAQKASGVATTGAANAFKVLTAAMIANPITAIVVGITAIISAMYLFSDSTDEATAKQKELTDALEKQTAAQEANLSSQKDVDVYRKGGLADLQREVDLMKAKGINDKEVYEAETSLINQQITSLKNAAKERATLQYGVETGREVFNRKDYQSYKDLLNKKKIVEAEYAKSQADLTKKTQEESDKRTKIRKDEEDKKLLALRKAEIDSYNSEKEYSKKIVDNNIQRMSEESKLYADNLKTKLDLAREYYSTEIKANEDKYTHLTKAERSSNAEYLAEKKRINLEINNIVQKNNQELMEMAGDYLSILLMQEDAAFKERLIKFNANQISILQGVQVTNEETKLAALKHQKEMELIAANAIEDTTQREASIYEIKKRYQEEEKVLTNNIFEAKLEELKAKYEEELNLVSDNEAKKKAVKAKYASDFQELTNKNIEDEGNLIVEGINNEKALTKAKYDYKVSEATNYINKLSSIISQEAQAFQSIWNLQAEVATTARQEQYNKDSESLKAALGERTMTQELYDEKTRALETKKNQQEIEGKRKQFAQNKALAIANAAMGGAQAVVQALASSPPPLSFVLAGVSAGIAAVQLGVISSTKFKANRGGKVPGQPSSVDSVDALLAPGEMVINSTSSKMFAPVLSAINQAGGGVQLAPEVSHITQTKSQAVYGTDQPIVKAYVSETDMTDAQSRVSRFRNNNRF